jgi:hypothetical protein
MCKTACCNYFLGTLTGRTGVALPVAKTEPNCGSKSKADRRPKQAVLGERARWIGTKRSGETVSSDLAKEPVNSDLGLGKLGRELCRDSFSLCHAQRLH